MKHKLLKLKLLAPSLMVLVVSTGAFASHIHNAERRVSFSNESAHLQGFERYANAGVSGAAWLDYDADEDLDLFIPNRAGNQGALFENLGNGEFSDITIEAGLADFNGYTSVVAGDIDNDGYPDLYLSGEGGYLGATTRSRLYHNNGDGTFTDISATSNTPGTQFNGSVAMADFNNDGLLDIIVSGATHLGFLLPPMASTKHVLYMNNGDLTFSNTTESAGLAVDVGACVARPTDHNNDGWMDIIIPTCMAPFPYQPRSSLHLYQNNKDGTFTDVTKEVGLTFFGAWMGLALGDYDNDGDFDIFATNDGVNLNGASILLRRNSDGTYTNVTPNYPSLGWFGWGTTFADWDNDGDVDLFYAGNWQALGMTGNAGYLYISDGKGNLVEDTQALGVNLENIQASGIARADYNGDGFMDMVVATEAYQTLDPNTGEIVKSAPGYPYLFKNRGNNNNWVTIRPKGTISNRMGIGARLTLYTYSGRQIREIVAGSSFASTETPWPTFGMGRNRAGLLKVDWPSGKKELFIVWNGRTVNIVEGRGLGWRLIRNDRNLDSTLQGIAAKLEKRIEENSSIFHFNKTLKDFAEKLEIE